MLPSGINSAPEHFQHQMSQILASQNGAICHIDNVLIFTQQEHDKHLHSAPSKIQKAGLTPNTDKFEFNKPEINFLWHVINRHGISPDPWKIDAVLSIDKPHSRLSYGTDSWVW